MPVTVVVGGQFGSEGKGKVAFELARREGARYAIRIGGPNSGHTVISESGERIVLRQLPTAALHPQVTSLLPAGSYINLQVLQGEIKHLHLVPDRLRIHPNACVITQAQIQEESASNLNRKLGSTETGVGAAVRARVWRQGDSLLAKDCKDLRPYLDDFSQKLRASLSNGERALIEGTQGFGLSLLHSPYYPFATSRDTTAAGFVSEAGLSPLDIDDVIMVIRAFPIRVAGNSGPLPSEISWEQVSEESGAQSPIAEYTSVTNRLRRVARFDAGIVQQAICHNNPTRIALNHVDYLDMAFTGQERMSSSMERFVHGVESTMGKKVDFIGTGPAALLAVTDIDSCSLRTA
jgi:adenylosuccinate synthase